MRLALHDAPVRDDDAQAAPGPVAHERAPSVRWAMEHEAYWRARCLMAEATLAATETAMGDMRCQIHALRMELARAGRAKGTLEKRIVNMTTLPLQAASARLTGMARMAAGSTVTHK